MSKLYKLPKCPLKKNVVYCADNLEVMKQLPSESIDLIYIDPPFGTTSLRKSKTWDNKVQGLSFYDNFGGGIKSYISFMQDRLEQMYRLLKKNGILCIHLDFRAVHYIKTLCDEHIFCNKKGKFIGEIFWPKGRNKNGRPRSSNHKQRTISSTMENILIYSKSKKYYLNEDFLFKPLSKEKLKNKYKRKDENGYFKTRPAELWAEGKRKNLIYEYKGYIPQYGWRMKKSKLIEVDKNNNLGWSKNNKPYIKLRPKSDKGELIDNLWDDIFGIQGKSQENLGYPTQKPIDLLKRIINIFSKREDIIADFFCGCGTTMSAAEKLGRYWIGVDANKKASQVIRKRMARDHNLKIQITPLKNLTKQQALELDPFEFEKYIIRCIGGIPNEKQRSDGGIDGRLIEDGTPIQVKKSKNVGRNVLDNFHKHLRRNGRGIIIALSFSNGAKEESHRLKLDEGKDLQLLTLDKILREGTQSVA